MLNNNLWRLSAVIDKAASIGRLLAQAFSAFRYDMAWRLAHPGAFREYFEQAISNLPQGICLYDACDRLLLVNEQFCRIYNQPMHRLRIGMTLYEVLADSCKIGNYPGQTVEEIHRARKAFLDLGKKGTFLQTLGDGRLIAIHHQPLKSGGWVCTYDDVTEQRRERAKIEFLAHHDGLTELPNRILFAERLQKAIAHASDAYPVSLLSLDLDGFKGVNDRLGHSAGDLLLKEVARRLLSCVPDGATAARLGGDEFAVVLPETSSFAAFELANRISATIRKPYILGAFGAAAVSTSIGIACAPLHASSSDELLLMADRALYRSKSARLGSPCVFKASELDAYVNAARIVA